MACNPSTVDGAVCSNSDWLAINNIRLLPSSNILTPGIGSQVYQEDQCLRNCMYAFLVYVSVGKIILSKGVVSVAKYHFSLGTMVNISGLKVVKMII